MLNKFNPLKRGNAFYRVFQFATNNQVQSESKAKPTEEIIKEKGLTKEEGSDMFGSPFAETEGLRGDFDKAESRAREFNKGGINNKSEFQEKAEKFNETQEQQQSSDYQANKNLSEDSSWQKEKGNQGFAFQSLRDQYLNAAGKGNITGSGGEGPGLKTFMYNIHDMEKERGEAEAMAEKGDTGRKFAKEGTQTKTNVGEKIENPMSGIEDSQKKS